MNRVGSGRVQSRCSSRPMSRPRLPVTATLSGPPSGRLVSFSMVSVSPMSPALAISRSVAGLATSLSTWPNRLHHQPCSMPSTAIRMPSSTQPRISSGRSVWLARHGRDQDRGADRARRRVRLDRDRIAARDAEAAAGPAGRERQMRRRQLAAVAHAEFERGESAVLLRLAAPNPRRAWIPSRSSSVALDTNLRTERQPHHTASRRGSR